MATDAQILKSILALRGISAKEFLANTEISQNTAYSKNGLFHDDTIYTREHFALITNILGINYGEVYFRDKRPVLSYRELVVENERLKKLLIEQELYIQQQHLLLTAFQKLMEKWLRRK